MGKNTILGQQAAKREFLLAPLNETRVQWSHLTPWTCPRWLPAGYCWGHVQSAALCSAGGKQMVKKKYLLRNCHRLIFVISLKMTIIVAHLYLRINQSHKNTKPPTMGNQSVCPPPSFQPASSRGAPIKVWSCSRLHPVKRDFFLVTVARWGSGPGFWKCLKSI